MSLKIRNTFAAFALVAVLGTTLAACGSDAESAATGAADSMSSSASSAADTMSSSASSAADTMSSSASSAADTMSSSASSAAGDMDPAANLFGPGCADYAKANPSGDASVAGMAALPVAQAAGANPLLTTLTSAVSGKLNPAVNLVDTLNGGEFTVFAPADSAFAKLPAETVATLGTEAGAETLTKVLTYHVISGQIAPDAIDGAHKTVEGGEVTVSGTGDDRTVTDANGGQAKIVCGGIKTQNATVYLIDTVLMPK